MNRIMQKRNDLAKRLWVHVNPSIKGYGDMIDRLIECVPLTALAKLVKELER